MQEFLPWLPVSDNWKIQIRELPLDDPKKTWASLIALANSRLDFIQTASLDKALRKHFSDNNPPPSEGKPVRLGVLASSTVQHLLPAIRVAALRRGLWCCTHEGEYGQYLQDVLTPHSALSEFGPNAILIALDAFHLAGLGPRTETADKAAQSLELLKQLWSALQRFDCPVIQQTLLPVFNPLMGGNEHRLPSSPAAVVRKLNEAIRLNADQHGVHLLALDDAVSLHGLGAWHDSPLWHHAKQEIAPAISPLYGDLVGRLLAALQGRTHKCLVLDLDNTLWGGVIGDDGLAGISLGQNSALGEAFIEFQRYVLQLSRRGVILAVCSKNDEENALAPFREHTEMVLRTSDIACFKANWDDKATNLKAIAKALNIGIDSLVFADDNPFERNQVRANLPMVAVPELPDDPALYSSVISIAGYFESVSLTDEDNARAVQYQENQKRQQLLETASDLDSYLKSLNMRLVAGPFQPSNIKRVTQLINKTNQFNLTTRRYSEEEVTRFANDSQCLTLQLSLTDKFGDSGIIGVVIGLCKDDYLLVDSWLMSCRVLGREVEQSTINMLAAGAWSMGASSLIGSFIPTGKNAMVKQLYENLGFMKYAENSDGSTSWKLPLQGFLPHLTHIKEDYAYAAIRS